MLESIHRQAFTLAGAHATPFLFLSNSRLGDSIGRFRKFTASLSFPVEAYYSFKTNYLPALCKEVVRHGFGAEVTSVLEWELARKLVSASSIVVNGIGKQAGLLEQVLQGDAPRLINVETDTEVDRLCRHNANAEILRVGVRVHVPGVTGEEGSDPTEHLGKNPAKFGWSATGRQIVEVMVRLSQAKNVTVEALHMHLGGQLVSAQIFRRSLAQICELLKELYHRGVRVSTLDIGGGLASGFVEKRRRGPLYELASRLGVPLEPEVQSSADLDGIAGVFRDYAHTLRGLGIMRLVAEPGRFIAEPAMLAVTRVVSIRHDDNSSCAVLDIGTNALACSRSDEKRRIVLDLNKASGMEVTYDLVGPLCHRGDTFGRITAPANLEPGTLVCIDAVGAYAFGDWVANTWLRPPVFMDDGREVWRRQFPAEFWAGAAGVGL
ncbi:diaminopimelate decarboxylase family protein [Actinosynnema sp. CA-299493]